MAGSANIGDANLHTVFKNVEQFADQYPGIERDGFAGFEVDVEARFGADVFNERDQFIPLIIGARDVVAAAKVQPA